METKLTRVMIMTGFRPVHGVSYPTTYTRHPAYANAAFGLLVDEIAWLRGARTPLGSLD